ncbi:MAG: DUF3179 domain-containing protein [Ignavibacteria bacterium]|nr:DUF3179 domain-containing protein [Ignavibacteria bacterium]
MIKQLPVILFLLSSIMFAQMKNPKNIPFNWKTDTTLTNIDLSELSIVLPRGSFAVLNYPQFVDKEEGLKSFFSKEPVLSVEINGNAKAYQLNMLSVHEIANDTLSGVPILSTFCPLCNSGIVYDRRLKYKGKDFLLQFEVSGMLRKSDMVMADKQTETWWQQLEGKGIVGNLEGAELSVIPSLVISVEEFFNRYPDGKILSKATGIEGAEEYYGKNFYKNYDNPKGKPYDRFFSPEDIDPRLPAMERIVDIRSAGEFKVYPFSAVEKTGVINDEFNGKNVVLFYQPGTISVLDEKEIKDSKDIGMVTVFNPVLDGEKLKFKRIDNKFIDENTNSVWDITGRCIEGKLKGKELQIEPHGNHFAFAWLAFYPETKIYGVE